MKKKLVALLVAVMAISLCACGKTTDDSKASGDVAGTDNTVVTDDTTVADDTADVDDTTVADDMTVTDGTVADDATVTDGTVADDMTVTDGTVADDATVTDGTVADDATVTDGTASDVLTFSNVTYSLGDVWSYYGDQSGTLIYQSADATERVAFYVQNETAYTADDLRAAYATQIIATYGDNYTLTSVDINGRAWDCYSYGSDNLLSSGICADLYVYSDGATTIYVENDYSSDKVVASGDIYIILNSITID